MSDPAVIGDRRRNAEVGRAYRQLEPAATLAAEWRHAEDDAAGAEELLAEGADDEQLRELLASSRERIAELEEEIRLAMVSARPQRRQARDRRGPGRAPAATRRACGPETSTGC